MAASVYPWWLVRHSTRISYVASLLAGLAKFVKSLGRYARMVQMGVTLLIQYRKPVQGLEVTTTVLTVTEFCVCV